MSYKVEARSASRDVWVMFDHPEQPVNGPWLRSDGRDNYDLVARGEVESVGFIPRFRAGKHGRRWGDLLWTTGQAKVASTRFVEALTELGATGWRSFPVELLGRDAHPVPGYVGFAAMDDDPTKDVSDLGPVPMGVVRVSDRIAAAMADRGVWNVHMRPDDT